MSHKSESQHWMLVIFRCCGCTASEIWFCDGDQCMTSGILLKIIRKQKKQTTHTHTRIIRQMISGGESGQSKTKSWRQTVVSDCVLSRVLRLHVRRCCSLNRPTCLVKVGLLWTLGGFCSANALQACSFIFFQWNNNKSLWTRCCLGSYLKVLSNKIVIIIYSLGKPYLIGYRPYSIHTCTLYACLCIYSKSNKVAILIKKTSEMAAAADFLITQQQLKYFQGQTIFIAATLTRSFYPPPTNKQHQHIPPELLVCLSPTS